MDVRQTLKPLHARIAGGNLYPSIVLHGADAEARRAASLDLARAILCTADPSVRPCGECANCRRVDLDPEVAFHPDFHPLERDLSTATSAAAVRRWVAEAQLAPFEARAKVFVMLEAETLGEDAADVLLKVLEEPPGQAGRHFLLLTPSDRELAPTIRSRSMSFYLGGPEGAEAEAKVVERLDRAFDGRAVEPLRLAAELLALDDWKDPRATQGWERAALALAEIGGRRAEPWLLDLASDLLQAPRWRIRGVPAHRIVEGSVAHRVPSSPEKR